MRRQRVDPEGKVGYPQPEDSRCQVLQAVMSGLASQMLNGPRSSRVLRAPRAACSQAVHWGKTRAGGRGLAEITRPKRRTKASRAPREWPCLPSDQSPQGGCASPIRLPRQGLPTDLALLTQVANMGRSIHMHLCSVRIPQAKENALSAITLLARNHTPELVAAFLDFSMPLDRCLAHPAPLPTAILPGRGHGLCLLVCTLMAHREPTLRAQGGRPASWVGHWENTAHPLSASHRTPCPGLPSLHLGRGSQDPECSWKKTNLATREQRPSISAHLQTSSSCPPTDPAATTALSREAGFSPTASGPWIWRWLGPCCMAPPPKAPL